MSYRPNILFFFTDDQRFDTIHALGNRDIITPNLDGFARQGVRFMIEGETVETAWGWLDLSSPLAPDLSLVR